METIRNIVRKKLFEAYKKDLNKSENKPGEYSTEEMSGFLLQLLDLIPWGDKNFGDGPHVIIPSYFPASTVCYTKESIRQNWEKSTQYNEAPDVKWYVWNAKIGVEPKYLAKQRIDLNSILHIAAEHPELFKYISIAVDSSEIRKKNISTQGD